MQLYDSGDGALTCLEPTGEDQRRILRRAKYEATDVPPEGFAAHWRSPIFMPRWASRIDLEVLSVGVERLQDINDSDARAEGMDWAAPHFYSKRDIKSAFDGREDPREVGYPASGGSFALDNYRRAWDAINGKRHPWSSNPWVWRIEFRRTKP